MKKLLSITILFLLVFITKTFSQDNVIEVEKYRVGRWSETNKKWNYSDFNYPDGLKVTLNGKMLYVNDKNKSYYILSDSNPEKTDEDIYESSSWYAKDKNNTKCLVTLTFYKEDGTIILSIMYSDFIINYIKKKYKS
jgi:DNA-binding beta-propeller fold protein YncE